jgi:hypothetical protein
MHPEMGVVRVITLSAALVETMPLFGTPICSLTPMSLDKLSNIIHAVFAEGRSKVGPF